MPVRTPSYRFHKARNCAVVTVAGKDHYLGPYESPESREQYHRLVAEYLAARNNPPPPPAAADAPLTVTELIAAYWKFVKEHFVKDGRPTSEQDTIRQALRFLRRLYGSAPAAEFSPKKLKAVRQAMVEHRVVRRYKERDPGTGEARWAERVLAVGLARRFVNKQVGRVRRLYAWAVEEELVPVEVHAALLRVKGLKKGKSAAREKPRVRPVPEALVEAVLPLVPEAVRAMILVQRLCGGRPQDVVGLRADEIDTAGPVWECRPRRYKTEHHNDGGDPDRERVVYLGPRAQEALRPYLAAGPEGYLFSPVRSEQARNAQRREGSKSPMTPSQATRRPRGRPRAPLRDHYDVASYRRAVRRACQKAGVPVWHPNQLRHSRLTEIRRAYGLEASRVCGGHREVSVTQHYAEQDRDLARPGDERDRLTRDAGTWVEWCRQASRLITGVSATRPPSHLGAAGGGRPGGTRCHR
jgi:integrase